MEDFNEKNIPIKARPSQMNNYYLNLCKKEIIDLLSKEIIRNFYSPWSYYAFYVVLCNECCQKGMKKTKIDY